jgi:hypothetical protein
MRIGGGGAPAMLSAGDCDHEGARIFNRCIVHPIGFKPVVRAAQVLGAGQSDRPPRDRVFLTIAATTAVCGRPH